MPKVSVIVPVYGVEKYIERCARSLFEQTLDDIEYIFVDDCTPDCSIDILKALIEEYRLRFAEMNYKVRIEKMPTNSGLPAVRRHGIQLATGDYIIHCDSDDWVDRDMYRQMYEKAIEDGADMVVCDYYSSDGETECSHIGANATDKIPFMKDLFYQYISWAVWNKLVKSSIYKKLQYFPKYNMGEDMVLIAQCSAESKSISYIGKPLYYYFTNVNSITKTNSKEASNNRFVQNKSNFDLILKYITDNGCYKSLKHSINWSKFGLKVMLDGCSDEMKNRYRSIYKYVEYQLVFDYKLSTIKKKQVIHYIINFLT